MTENSPKAPLLEVRNLHKHFPVRAGILRRTVGWIRAVDGITFRLDKGMTFGLVGESGCGKTTAGRTLVGLYRPTAGHLFFDVPLETIETILKKEHELEELVDQGTLLRNRREPEVRGQKQDLQIEIDRQKKDLGILRKPWDVYALKPREFSRKRREFQMVFQDPYGSLNPRMSVRDLVAEGLDIHGLCKTRLERRERVEELLDSVGMDPRVANRFPHEFSGGQRQRLGIARALALNPRLLVLDEPVSALDVSIRIQILDLLYKLKEDRGLTYLFIAHDMAVMEHFSDRVAVMYLGQIVEEADRQDLFTRRIHPYTRALLSAVPVPDPKNKSQRIILPGEVPSALHPPGGCRFHTRCPFVMDKCRKEAPPLEEKAPGHLAACWLEV